MTPRALPLAAAILVLVGAAQAQAPAGDPLLDRVLEEAAERSPELAQARAAVRAEAARIPQAGALADPVVSLGIQNDGFKEIAIGTMETSYLSIMATQALPFPGKRGLRSAVATAERRRAEAIVARLELSLEAQVRRAWLDWLLGREQAGLLDELGSLWAQAEAAARSRYESGQAPQSDLLRAQLERARLEQRRWASAAEVQNRLAKLNRLRGRPLDEPLATSRGDLERLSLLPERIRRGGGEERGQQETATAIPPMAQALADAEARSPELGLSSIGVEQAASRVELARKERWPDLSVGAALMIRGSLAPMWQLSVGFGVPLFIGQKQDRAVEEGEARGVGAAQGREAIRQVLALRTSQRLQAIGALERINRRTREVILPLSEATARSALAQYEVGRVSFTAVLEALASWVGDRTAYLGSLADARRIAIAQHELALDAPVWGGGSIGGGAMPQASGGPSAPAGRGPGAPAGGERPQERAMGGGM